MNGLFIGKKVNARKNVIFNTDNLGADCPVLPPNDSFTEIIVENEEAEVVARFAIELEVSAWPNPSDTDFNLKVKTPSGEYVPFSFKFYN